MKAGKLRDRVNIETLVQSNESADVYGRTDTYSTGTTVWADVALLSAEKRYVDNTERRLVTRRVDMRWNDDVKAGLRLKWGDKYLYINDISGDKAKGTMTLMCSEEVTG